jgi:transcriptional regulator with XRE-family HTH domain
MTPPPHTPLNPWDAEEQAGELRVIATRLQAARARRGWSRETLAHFAGLSSAGIAQIESGRRRNVRPDTLSSLASALGVTVDYLLGAESDRTLLAHGALFYGSTDEFLDATIPLLSGAIERSEGVLVVSNRANVALLKQTIGRDAKRIRFEESQRWYETPLAATESYREFIREQLTAGLPWVTVVGEPLWEGRRGEVAPWLTYEAMFNLVFAGAPMTTICPYDSRHVDPSVLERARLTHPAVLTSSGQAGNPAYRGVTEYLLGGRSARASSARRTGR